MVKTSFAHLYALSLGSNRPLTGRLTPARLLDEATRRIADLGRILATSPKIQTDPIGPSKRVFVNSALLVESALPPDAMLCALQAIERALGRQRFQRWGARRLDIDIILWSGGRLKTPRLTIPHPAFRERDFVLTPLSAIAPNWRDPVSGLSVRQLRVRRRKAIAGG